MSLMLEVPFMNIEKYILFPPKNNAIKQDYNKGKSLEKNIKFYPLNEEGDTSISSKNLLKE